MKTRGGNYTENRKKLDSEEEKEQEPRKYVKFGRGFTKKDDEGKASLQASKLVTFAKQLEYLRSSNKGELKGKTPRNIGNRKDKDVLRKKVKVYRKDFNKHLKHLWDDTKTNIIFVGYEAPDDNVRYMNITPGMNLSSFETIQETYEEIRVTNTYLCVFGAIDVDRTEVWCVLPSTLDNVRVKKVVPFRSYGAGIYNAELDGVSKEKLEALPDEKKQFVTSIIDPKKLYDWILEKSIEMSYNEEQISYVEGIEPHMTPDLRDLLKEKLKDYPLDIWNLGGVFGDAVIPGISRVMFYIGMSYTGFGAHLEDLNLPSLILMLLGRKILVLIRSEYAIQFIKLTRETFVGAKCVMQHRFFMPYLQKLDDEGIQYTVVELKAGETFFIPAGHVHFGFNVGLTVSMSVNVGTIQWLESLPSWIRNVPEKDISKLLTKNYHVQDGFEKEYKSCKPCRVQFQNVVRSLDMQKLNENANKITRRTCTFWYGKLSREGKGAVKCKSLSEGVPT